MTGWGGPPSGIATAILEASASLDVHCSSTRPYLLRVGPRGPVAPSFARAASSVTPEPNGHPKRRSGSPQPWALPETVVPAPAVPRNQVPGAAPAAVVLVAFCGMCDPGAIPIAGVLPGSFTTTAAGDRAVQDTWSPWLPRCKRERDRPRPVRPGCVTGSMTDAAAGAHGRSMLPPGGGVWIGLGRG